MNSRNKLIYLIRSIIGEDETSGFFTYVENNGETIKVPNYLFKDAPAEYPEIRISPFITDVEATVPQHKYCCNNFAKLHHYHATFQVDIYATTIPMLNNIYEQVYRRIDYFHDFDSITYGYDKSFEQIDDEIYHSEIYTPINFNIFRIIINNNIIHRVDNIDELYDNTYTINEDGLYIRTTLPIQDIEIKHSINGLLFNNHKTSFHEHIINMSIFNVKMLSELENDDVERISFNLSILYHMLRKRDHGPILKDVIINSDKNGS